MGSGTSIADKNFGLSSVEEQEFIPTEDPKFDSWFWESKSQKKLRQDTKRAEIERMRAETAAMQQILTEQENAPNNQMNVGRIALIGGLVLLLGIGAIVLLKKKQVSDGSGEDLVAENLMV